MASGTVSTRPPENAPIAGRYEDFIQQRLEYTRQQVRLVDVGSGVVLLAAASLFFLLAVAVADHWFFAHGLSFAVRLLLWAAWVSVAGWFAWRWVAPSVMHRINPVYAAQTIEQRRPTLKNSLINFLLLRAHPDEVAPAVYRAMEHRAASDLSRVPVEHAVDHRRLVRLCYVLAVAVVLFALYLAVSPKNPLVSAARVLWPWTSLPAPTRVHIEDVQPGDAVVFQGDRQEITAHVSGLRNGEDVALLISTADAQLVDDRVVMSREGEDDRYACRLPSGEGGMQQTTTYRIVAGDATTQQFKLDVRIAPTIIVDQVDYHVPRYVLDSKFGPRDRSVKGQGDIKGLEGTRVTVHATANLEIKEAYIDLGSRDAPRRIAMKHDGKRATGEFTLALDPERNWQPLYDRYEVVFKDLEGHDARHPLRYHIDVDRDYPPGIEIVEPKQESAVVAASGHLRLAVSASDDFGLRHVALRAELSGRRLDLPVLMDRIPPEKALDAPFKGDYEFRPAAFQLHKGDEVTYWAEAEDNKEPQHNRRETTPRRTIRIVDEQEAKQGESNQEKQQGENQGQQGEGQRQQGKNGSGTNQSAADQPSDGSHDKASGAPSASKNQGGKGDPNRSPDTKPDGKNHSGTSDKSKNDKNAGAKGGSSSDANNGEGSDSQPGESAGEEKKALDKDTQAPDVIKKSLKDWEKQQKNGEQPPEENSHPGENQAQQPQDGGNQPSGNPNNDGQANKSAQGNSEDKSPQGGRGGKPQPGSEKGNSHDGNSAESQPGAKPGEPGANPAGQQPNAGKAGQQPDAGNANSGARRGQNTSPPGGGTPSRAGQNGGEKQNTGPSSSQNQGANQASQGANQAPSENPENRGANAGAESQRDPRRAGDGNKSHDGQQASGGTNSPENKKQDASGGTNSPENKKQDASGGTNSPENKKQDASGGRQGASPQGGSMQNAERKPGGSGDDSNNSQLAMKGQRPGKKVSERGGSDGQQGPADQQPGNKTKPENGSAQGGGQNSQSPKREDQSSGGGAGDQQQPKPDNGEKRDSRGGGQNPSDERKQGDQGKTTDGQPRQADPSNKGDSRLSSQGAPDSQVDRQRPGNKSGQAREGLGPKSDNNAQSPGNSPHDSNSTGESEGERRGGGGKGGGEQNQKAGRGSAGSSSDAKHGGSASDQKGDDAAGHNAGESLKATNNTDSTHKATGSGSGKKTESSDRQASDDSQQPNENPTAGGNPNQAASPGGQSESPSSQPSDRQGAGQPSGGSRAGSQPDATSQSRESKPDEADPEFAQKQVDLALRHLKDEMSKPKSELLDKLGWTPEEAKRFVENIDKLRDSAKQPGNEADNKKYKEFLKDLGLRPHGTRLQGGRATTDNLGGVRDAGQINPPAEWEEQTREFSRSAAQQK